jgi:transcriptional regulator with XRE-family HTH domain
MSRRPTIADLARAAGVSVATVDRVLNARHRVREPTAERVIGAADAIGYHAATLLKTRLRTDLPERTFAFLLQRPDAFYTQFGGDLAAATRARSPGFAASRSSISRPTFRQLSSPSACSGSARARMRSPSSRSITRASATRSPLYARGACRPSRF